MGRRRRAPWYVRKSAEGVELCLVDLQQSDDSNPTVIMAAARLAALLGAGRRR